MLKKYLKALLFFGLSLIGILILLLILLFAGVTPKLPDPPTDEISIYNNIDPVEVDSGLYVLERNWIRQNRYGLWEMYVEGDPFNRGVAAGKLSKHLVQHQEEVFVAEIDKVIPSKRYQRLLLVMIAWFNKNLTNHVPVEYLKEIYGISLSASEAFASYGPSYLRLLNYHAAHDIGHAMQNYYLVGCSSFAAWNEKTRDSSLITGRNFDFYFGDAFAKHKIVEFVAPDSGNNFAYVTWGGMIGVVSGMNDKGLTVTINAGTLDIGYKSATPVTLVAREILQHASNIKEAAEIAANRNIFVSESFLISSAYDNQAVIIEKKPDASDIAYPHSSSIICTNHFQSDEFKQSAANMLNEQQNATGYRFLRIQELMNEKGQISPTSAAAILRNKKGSGNMSIGFGNEKAINQLLAHHSILFEPEKKLMWISTPPNVMGPYVAYDLEKIFTRAEAPDQNTSIDNWNLTIPADSFIFTTDYEKYLTFKKISKRIREFCKSDSTLTETEINQYKSLNPDYFETYQITGDYYYSKKKYAKASENYQIALSKESNSFSVREYLQKQLRKSEKNISTFN